MKKNILLLSFFFIFSMLSLCYAQGIRGIVEPLQLNTTEYTVFGSENKNDSLYSKTDTVIFITSNEFPPQQYPSRQTTDTVTAVITYERGIKIKVVSYYNNGKIYREAFFNEQGKYQGLDIKWYKSGQKYLQSYFENGKEVTPILVWYENGELNRYSALDSKTNKGMIKEWFLDGKLKEETIGLDTTATCGIKRYYHENGQLAIEFIYNCGKQYYINYHNNGNKRMEGYIVDAMWSQVGKWTEFYYNGKKKVEMYYNDNYPNKKEGKWLYWDEQGNLVKEEVYENNELIKTKEFVPINKMR